MADVQQSHANGDQHATAKRKTADSDASHEPPALLKRMKVEQDAPPEANPNTVAAVTERNRAMALDLCEKNRRIAFLTSECAALYRSRAVADTALRCVRQQWLTLHADIDAALQTLPTSSSKSQALDASSSDWRDVFVAAERFALLDVPTTALTLELPEWFIAIGQDKPVTAADQIDTTDSTADNTIAAADTTRTISNSSNATTFVARSDLSAIESELQQTLERDAKRTSLLVTALVDATAAAAAHAASSSTTAAGALEALVGAKHTAVAHALALTDRVQQATVRIAELERIVAQKEVERHRACREFDRLSHFVDRNAATIVDPATQASVTAAATATTDAATTDAVKTEANTNNNNATEPLADAVVPIITPDELDEKNKALATLRANQTILTTKLYSERAVVADLRNELERFRVLETAWQQETAALTQAKDDQLTQVRDEKQQLSDEFNKIRHKAKDIETHVHDKWKKKLGRLQADMTKLKSQMDELNLKNVALREKLATAAGMKDQLSELKSTHASLTSENARLTAQLARATTQLEHNATTQATAADVAAWTQKVALLEATNKDLEAALAVRTHAATPDNELAQLRLRDAAHVAALATERTAHAQTTAALATLQRDCESLQASEAATREENDALISELETIGKEVHATRHARRKLTQQVDEKRTSAKKLHTQLAKEEQAKAHCFEELAAARLQVSALTAVHKQQNAALESLREALAAKTNERDALATHVTAVATERDAAEASKRQNARDADVAKHQFALLTQTTTQQLLHEQRRACETCEGAKKREARAAAQLEALQASVATGGALTDLERFELQDLQKLVNCSVCQDRRKNVLIAKCFHLFCRECVDSNLRSRNRKCPTCKQMFGHDDVKTVWFT